MNNIREAIEFCDEFCKVSQYLGKHIPENGVMILKTLYPNTFKTVEYEFNKKCFDPKLNHLDRLKAIESYKESMAYGFKKAGVWA